MQFAFGHWKTDDPNLVQDADGSFYALVPDGDKRPTSGCGLAAFTAGICVGLFAMGCVLGAMMVKADAIKHQRLTPVQLAAPSAN